MYDNEVKENATQTVKKVKHKHDFQPCVFEYDGIRLDKAHGFVPSPNTGFGGYCTICGKSEVPTMTDDRAGFPSSGGPPVTASIRKKRRSS